MGNIMTEHQRWLNDKGDQTLRYDYPLDHTAIIFDLGGYEGQWSKIIWNRFEPTVYIFEPVNSFYQTIEDDPKCAMFKKFKCGLGKRTEDIEINISRDGSSIFTNEGNDTETISIVDIKEFIDAHNIHTIDLMKINIEGAEYDLLERIIEIGFLDKINHIQIQFHPWVDNYVERRENIINVLKKTHLCKYNYEMIWESWSIK